jgi:hypothetical protein
MPSNERREMLQDMYNFSCTCSLCTASPAEKDASDTRRARVSMINELLQRGQSSHAEAVRLTDELLVLIDKEHLITMLKRGYSHLIKLFYELSDYERAIKYMEATLTLSDDLGGPDEEEYRGKVRRKMLAFKRWVADKEDKEGKNSG